ncbi:MAG: hypothetical protein ACXVP0_05095 [Bacteroidia bacterium]
MKAVLSHLISECSPYGNKREYEWKEILWIAAVMGISVYLLVRVDCFFYNYLTT